MSITTQNIIVKKRGQKPSLVKIVHGMLFIAVLMQSPIIFSQSYAQKQWFEEHGVDISGYRLKESELESLIMILAIRESYPGKVVDVIYANSDWQIKFAGGQWLNWAGGRLLPKEVVANQKNYSSYFTSHYVKEIPNPKSFKPEQIRRLNQVTNPNSNHARLMQEGSYFKIQYGGTTKDAIEHYITTATFFGYRFQTHQLIVEPLARVEQKIKALQSTEIEEFIASLNYVASYEWRTIKSSKKYSYHSFGVAVDMLPKARTKALYWDWTRVYHKNWATLPLSQRWMVPDAIVDIFEDEGFIWGGKWMLYDNMHFEYRPELKLFYEWKINYDAL